MMSLSLEASAYIDTLNSKKHVLQVITDKIKGESAQFQFIKNGLTLGEKCIYFVHEDPSKVISRMKKAGLDTERFTKSGLLQIHRVPNVLSEADPFAAFQSFFASIVKNPSERFRLVGRSINDLRNKKAWDLAIQIERFMHSNFEQMNATVLCYYDYQKLDSKHTIQHVGELMKCHHGAIFSTLSEPNLALEFDRPT